MFAALHPALAAGRLRLLILLLCAWTWVQPAGAQEASTAAPVTPVTPASTSGPATIPDGPALMKTDRFRRLAAELRCLVCQNQSLVDSNAPLAQDLREEVVRLMSSGRDDQQIKSFLVDRYGEFVLYRPELSLRNALLWLGPFALLLVGAIAWWRLGRRAPSASPSATDALKHVDELLGR